MQKFSLHFAFAGLAALAFSASAQAQILNVQIGSHLYTGAGADTSAGDTWNLVPFGTQTSAAITDDSSGSPLTGVSFSDTAFGGFSFYGEATGNNLVDGYDYGYPGGTFSISGLAKDRPFTIYLYGTASAEAPGRTADFTLSAANGGLTATDVGRTTAESSSTFLPGFDYVVLTGTTSSTGTVSGTYSSAASNGEGDFNGLQINATTPEPSTYALMLTGLGVSALLLCLRRRA